MIKRVKKSSFIRASAFLQIFLMISLTFTLAIFLKVDMASGITIDTTSTSAQMANDVAKSIAAGAKPSSVILPSSVALPAGTTSTFVSGGNTFTYQTSGANAGTWTTTTSGIDPLTSIPTDATNFGYETYKVPGLGTTITNPIYGNLAQGLVWAVVVVGLVMTIGSLVGLSSDTTKALSYSLAGGILAGKLAIGLIQKGTIGTNGFVNSLGGASANQVGIGVGLIVAAAIFIMMYKDVTKKTITFTCLPYEAPLGGAKCEQCNGNALVPCSEYRCKSLGQACAFLNAGTKEEQCAWVGRNDVSSPTITPWVDALKPQTSDLKLVYAPDTAIRPPSIGTKIVNSNGKCLPAFTPLQFGIITNEPAQCKIDYNHTAKLDDMQYYLGGDNYYIYNHTQQLVLPSPTLNSTNPTIYNGGNASLYIRCRDANGNENVDEYVIDFCVDQTPDTTPPIIENFSITSGSYVSYNVDQVPIDVYVNEPADCKWSTESKSYDDMENSMSCAQSADQFNADLQYTCSGNLTGIQNMQDNNFYFKCRDQPTKDLASRNTMVTSTLLTLKGSQPLDIFNITPNDTITGSTSAVNVYLGVETEHGAENGKATCYFSNTNTTDSFIAMYSTDNYLHNQTLTLGNGNYTYYVRCLDAGGNLATGSTTFSVYVDNQAPIVTRLYQEFSALKVVTNEDAECSYSQKDCNFDFADGTAMQYASANIKNNLYADWKPSQTYYIKCRDAYGNEPSPNMCSAIAMPIQLTNSTKN